MIFDKEERSSGGSLAREERSSEASLARCTGDQIPRSRAFIWSRRTVGGRSRQRLPEEALRPSRSSQIISSPLDRTRCVSFNWYGDEVFLSEKNRIFGNVAEL